MAFINQNLPLLKYADVHPEIRVRREKNSNSSPTKKISPADFHPEIPVGREKNSNSSPTKKIALVIRNDQYH